MTAPRPVHAGATYLITRRCLGRQLLLRPSSTLTQLFAYVLACAAKRTGVRIHAFCVLSNHYHLVVTDPGARLPAFQQYLDAIVARATNALLGRWETFWAPHSYSAVTLGTPDDIVAKVAYTLANPVAAGLVEAGRLWPGLWSAPSAFGTTLRAPRPGHFFDPEGLQPAEEELVLSVPPGFRSVQEFRTAVEAELARLEEAARAGHRGFLGRRRVLAQSPFSRPASEEPRGGLIPRIASRDRWRRHELLQRLEAFLDDYAEALRVWREGKVEAIFPAGTYLMRVAHGAVCAAPG